MNVIIGSFRRKCLGSSSVGDKSVKEISLSDVAILLSYSKKIFIVPVMDWLWPRRNIFVMNWMTCLRAKELK